MIKKVKIEDLITYEKGKPPSEFKYTSNEKLPYLTPDYLRNRINKVELLPVNPKYIIVDDSDIILLWDGSNAGEFFRAKQGILASTMVVLKKKSTVKKDFLYYIMKSIESFLKSQTSGSGIPHVDKDIFLKKEINLLSRKNQMKAAQILKTIDSEIRKTQEIIKKFMFIKDGLMLHLLTKGIDHDEFRHSELGVIPSNWRILKISDICEIVSGGTPSTQINEFWNCDIPWAIPSDITSLDGSVFISKTKRNISHKGLAKSSANLLPAGSLLLTTRATIGYSAINTIPMATNQGFQSLIPKKDISNIYLHFYFNFIKRRIEILSSGSTFKEISKSNLASVLIPIPPFTEQKKIIDVLFLINNYIITEKSYYNKLNLLKLGLIHDLLEGKRNLDGKEIKSNGIK